MADPVRSKVLYAVAEGFTASAADDGSGVKGGGLSVRQIAERTGEPRRRVRYHLDALQEDGIVEIAEERRRKGVVERFFRLVGPTFLTDEDLSSIPEKQQRAMLIACIKAIFANVSSTLRTPGIAVRRSGWVAGRVAGEVDEQGWSELSALQIECVLEAQRITQRSQDRLRQTGSVPIRMVSANLFLESPSPE